MADNPQTTQCNLTKRMKLCIEKLAKDLQAEIDARYNGTQNKYPSEMIKYRRDMDTVWCAHHLLRDAKDAGI